MYEEVCKSKSKNRDTDYIYQPDNSLLATHYKQRLAGMSDAEITALPREYIEYNY